MAHSVTINPYSVQAATESVIKDFASDNVIYLELRSTLRCEDGMTKAKYLDSIIAGIKNSKLHNPSITVKLIVSLNRKDSIQEAEENVDLAIEFSKLEPDIVVGIDLSGDPNQKSFTDYIRILNKARKEGLKLTVHFAEIPGDKEINNVINFQPDRLGHGTFVHPSTNGSLYNWTLLLESKIPVEICITSNLKCKTVDSVGNHQFKHLYNAGHPVILGVSKSTQYPVTSCEYS